MRPQIEQTPIKKPTLDPCAPPEHLSAEARGWWNRIADAYELGPEHLLPLREALEAFDRCEAARKEIEATGLTVEDRFGQKRPNPLLAIERDSRSALLRAWRQIGLDIEPPGPVGYPAGRPRGGAA